MGFNFESMNKKGSTLKWDISKLKKDEVEWLKLTEMVKEAVEDYEDLDNITFYGFMIYKTKFGGAISIQTDKKEMVQIPNRYIEEFRKLPVEAIDEMFDKGITIHNFEIFEYNGKESVRFEFKNND